MKNQGSSGKRRYRYEHNHSTAVEQLSGLALNVRKQTSPETATVFNSNGAYVLTVKPELAP